MTDAQCPYGANECPKLSEIKSDIKSLETTVEGMSTNIATMTQTLRYVTAIVAILMTATFGFSIFRGQI